MLKNYLSPRAYESLKVERLIKYGRAEKQSSSTFKGRPHKWEPIDTSPQELGFHSEADELYYGGAAGGGKTDLIIGAGIENHQRALILRREFSQIKDIVERSKDIVGDFGRYNGKDHIHRLRDGRRLEFGGCLRETDWRKYAGRARDLMAFDELPEFTETQYRALVGWVRSIDPEQRCRVIGAGNPPTDEVGAWVIDYWAPWLDPEHENPAVPGELRWFVRVEDEDLEVPGPEPYDDKGELLQPRSRTFIPASLDDNPYLRDTGYKGVLQGLPEPLRSMLLYGDFQAGLSEDAFQLVPRSWLEAAFKRHEALSGPITGLTIAGCDPSRGGKDECVIYKRYDNWFDEAIVEEGEKVDDGPKVAALVIKNLDGRLNTPVNIDPIGIGSSPHDSLIANNINSRAVNFAAKAIDMGGQKLTDSSGKMTFRNVRAAGYWKLREALDPKHGDDLAIPRDNKLRRELMAHRWKLTTQGIQIHDKQEVKDIIGRSPGRSDALVFSLWTESLVGSWDDVEDLTSVDDLDRPWR